MVMCGMRGCLAAPRQSTNQIELAHTGTACIFCTYLYNLFFLEQQKGTIVAHITEQLDEQSSVDQRSSNTLAKVRRSEELIASSAFQLRDAPRCKQRFISLEGVTPNTSSVNATITNSSIARRRLWSNRQQLPPRIQTNTHKRIVPTPWAMEVVRAYDNAMQGTASHARGGQVLVHGERRSFPLSRFTCMRFVVSNAEVIPSFASVFLPLFAFLLALW
jgi:hypothetical protein